MSDNTNPLGTTTIRIDRSPEVEKEKQEKEQERKDKQKLLEIAKSQLPEQFREMVTDIPTLEMAQKLTEQESAKTKQAKASSANGSVSLQSNMSEGGKPLYRQKPKDVYDSNGLKQNFESVGEMTQYLASESKKGNEQAKQTLNALWLKSGINNSDRPERFVLEGTLAQLLEGKTRFVRKNLTDSESEDREMQA